MSRTGVGAVWTQMSVQLLLTGACGFSVLFSLKLNTEP